MENTKITEKQINREFIITYCKDSTKPSNYKIVSARQFIEIVGKDLACRKFEILYSQGQDEYIFKFRRGISFKFISR